MKGVLTKRIKCYIGLYYSSSQEQKSGGFSLGIELKKPHGNLYPYNKPNSENDEEKTFCGYWQVYLIVKEHTDREEFLSDLLSERVLNYISGLIKHSKMLSKSEFTGVGQN